MKLSEYDNTTETLCARAAAMDKAINCGYTNKDLWVIQNSLPVRTIRTTLDPDAELYVGEVVISMRVVYTAPEGAVVDGTITISRIGGYPAAMWEYTAGQELPREVAASAEAVVWNELVKKTIASLDSTIKSDPVGYMEEIATMGDFENLSGRSEEFAIAV